MTKIETTGMMVVDGVTVDISIEGEEDKAEKTMLHLKEQLGLLAAAYNEQKPPGEFDTTPVEYRFPMTVAWERYFEGYEQ